MYAKVEFQIQILHSCHLSNADNAYTFSIEKINPLQKSKSYIHSSQRIQEGLPKNLIKEGPTTNEVDFHHPTTSGILIYFP